MHSGTQGHNRIAGGVWSGTADVTDKDLRVTPGLRPTRAMAAAALCLPGTLLLCQGAPCLSIGVWRAESLRRLHVVAVDIGPMISHHGLDFHQLRGDALRVVAYERVADRIQGVIADLPALPEPSAAAMLDCAERHMTDFGWRRLEPELMPTWQSPVFFRRGETVLMSGRLRMLDAAVDRAPFLPLCRAAGVHGATILGVLDTTGQIGLSGMTIVALPPADLAGLQFMAGDRQITRGAIERDPRLGDQVRRLVGVLADAGAALPELTDPSLCAEFDHRLGQTVRIGGFSLKTQKAIATLRAASRAATRPASV